MAEERTLKQYVTPSTEESYVIISLVQENQFFGSPIEDLNLHISTILRLSGTLNANQEAVRLHLFPFSLRDRASSWFHSLEIGSITSWDRMRRAFITRFFPLSKTVQLRARLYQFTQKDGKSLYDAWDPHHGLEKWLIIHTFYNGLLYTTKIYVDAAAGGALMNKTYTTAYALIENMAQNHYQWTSERVITASSPSKKRGRHA